jgi:hypothetical protein
MSPDICRPALQGCRLSGVSPAGIGSRADHRWSTGWPVSIVGRGSSAGCPSATGMLAGPTQLTAMEIAWLKAYMATKKRSFLSMASHPIVTSSQTRKRVGLPASSNELALRAEVTFLDRLSPTVRGLGLCLSDTDIDCLVYIDDCSNRGRDSSHPLKGTGLLDPRAIKKCHRKEADRDG